jgi:type IV pilus assembly protein PilC
MPVYIFRGKNVRTNEPITGERFSNSAQALATVLRREQIAPVSIREKSAPGLSFKFGTGVKQHEIAIFTRQFSVMLDAGLPLVQCIQAIGEEHPNAKFKAILEVVRTDIEAGSTLSDALARHPKVFDSLYTNMIAAGEAGGILDTILQRLAVFIEKIVKLKKALRSASVYPSIILSVAVIVVTIILWKVIPVFKTLFEGFNVELPLLTRMVIGLSAFVESYILFIVIAIGLGVFGLRTYYRTEAGRLVVDRFLLRAPILGDILRKIAVARFTRTLSTLLTSGVPILEGMDITARTAGNAVLENVILTVRRHIEEGKTMVDPMRQSKFFPPMVIQMVAVGESAGELDNMLLKVADYFEEEVDTIVANMLTILEPVLLVIMGVIVGGIVIAMYLPLFKLIRVLSGAG